MSWRMKTFVVAAIGLFGFSVLFGIVTYANEMLAALRSGPPPHVREQRSTVAAVPESKKLPPGPYYIVMDTDGWNATVGEYTLAKLTVWKTPAFSSFEECDDWITQNIPGDLQDRLMDIRPSRGFACRSTSPVIIKDPNILLRGLSIDNVIYRLERFAPNHHIEVVWLEQFSLSEWQQ